MLSDRRQIVLRALIEEYIARAIPVGSRTLVERYNLGISSATVRNELSILEQAGYLVQPHTSAGRIPTDFGYRAFVDSLLAEEHAEIEEEDLRDLYQCADELDELFEKTSAALARLTDCMTVLVPPRMVACTIKQINLIVLMPQRLLLVVISDDGRVFDRQVELSSCYTDADIEKTQHLLNEALVGKPFSLTSAELPLEVLHVTDELFRLLIREIALCLKEHSIIKPQSLGMTKLLGKPEFSNSAQLLPILQELEDDTMLLHVFDDVKNSDNPFVRIGHENDSLALSGVSLVATRFGDEQSSGLIAIVGPTRMNYSQVFKAVRAAKRVLQDI